MHVLPRLCVALLTALTVLSACEFGTPHPILALPYGQVHVYPTDFLRAGAPATIYVAGDPNRTFRIVIHDGSVGSPWNLVDVTTDERGLGSSDWAVPNEWSGAFFASDGGFFSELRSRTILTRAEWERHTR